MRNMLLSLATWLHIGVHAVALQENKSNCVILRERQNTNVWARNKHMICTQTAWFLAVGTEWFRFRTYLATLPFRNRPGSHHATPHSDEVNPL